MRNRIKMLVAACAAGLCLGLALAPSPAGAGTVEMLESSVNFSNTTVSPVSSPKEIDISSIDSAALWVTTTNKSVVGSVIVALQRSPDGTIWSSDTIAVTQEVAAGTQKILRSALADADLVGIKALRLYSVASTTNIGTNTISSVLLAF